MFAASRSALLFIPIFQFDTNGNVSYNTSMSTRITIRPRLIEFWQPADWLEIRDRLIQEHGARMAISYVMRRELGFTMRRHRALVPNDPHHVRKDGPSMHYEEHICLDFYTDAAQSWFQLRYL